MLTEWSKNDIWTTKTNMMKKNDILRITLYTSEKMNL
jgi:hypothetical protein